MMRFLSPLLALCFSLLSFANAQDYGSLLGRPPGVATLPVRGGQVTLDSGNLFLDIPLYSRSARGVPAAGYHLYYNSQFWNGAPIGGGGTYPVDPQNVGWGSGTGSLTVVGVDALDVQQIPCPGSNPYGTALKFNFWRLTLPDGRTESLFTSTPTYNIGCSDINGNPYTGWNASNGYPTTATASSGDGYTLVINNGNIPTVFDARGDVLSGFPGPETPNGNLAISSAPTSEVAIDDIGSPLFPIVPSACDSRPPSESDYLYDIPYEAKPARVCADTTPAWDGSGATATYTFTTSYIPVCTNFFSGQANNAEFCGGVWVLTSIQLPDNTFYTFTYDSGTTPGHYGTLIGITWPTGGSTSFTYRISSQSPAPLSVLLATVTEGNDTTTLTYNTTASTTYAGSISWYPITITYPAHQLASQGQQVTDTTTYTFSESYSNGISAMTLSHVDILNGTTVKTTSQDYFDPAMPSFTQTTWNETGDTTRLNFTYAGNAQLSDEQQLINGNLYRRVHTTFLGDDGTSAYNSQFHMLAYPSSQQLYDANNNLIEQTNYSYDEYGASFCPSGLTPITGASGHDDSRGSNWYARGNPTTVSYTGQGGVALTTHKCYDTLGNVTQTIDGNGNVTQFSYADSFSDSSCLTSGSPTYALPTTVTDALGHVSTFRYASCVRAATKAMDPNDIANNSSGTTTSFDTMGRSKCVAMADGGQTCTNFQPGSATTYQVTQTLSSGLHAVNITLDPFGQPNKQIDQNTNVETDTFYGTNGLLLSRTNAYLSSSFPSGTTSYFYDGDGRLVNQQQPDGSTLTHTYVGLKDYSSDEAGNTWMRASDPLGRLLSVTEPINSPTTYGYDVLGNLKSVTQGSGGCVDNNGVITCHTGDSRTRSFTYDGLSHLLTATNPETGTVCYGLWSGGSVGSGSCGNGYDTNGNLVAQTDARGVITRYEYDALNRLRFKRYNDGTPVDAYSYDGYSDQGQPLADLGLATSNAIGRLSMLSNQVGSGQAYAYDAVGRLTTQYEFTPSTFYWTQMKATYDTAGNRTSLTYPDGRMVSYGLDNAGRVSSVSDASGGGVSNPGTYLSIPAGGYDFAGHVVNATIGSGIAMTSHFDGRQRVKDLSYGTAGSALWTRQYNWTVNGNLQSWTPDQGMTSRNFSYDAVNRLKTAQDVSNNPQAQLTNPLNEAYSYDAFGNLLQNGPFQVSVTANNQMFGYSYDASGNLLSDQVANTMTWDGANRLRSVGGETYAYDAQNERLEKAGSTTVDTYYFDGQPIAMLSNGQWKDLIYGPTGMIAEVPGTQTTNPIYRLTDHLGTLVGNAQADGSSFAALDYTPFGRVYSGSSSDGYQFTGKERDTESGLDYFGARYYGSNMGRFMSPDPSGLAYSNIGNPQSFNLYSYGRNNPLTNIDPTGLDCVHVNNDTGAYEGFESGDCDNSTEAKANSGYYVDGTVNNVAFTNKGQVDGYSASSGDGFFGTPGSNSGPAAANFNPYSGAVTGPGQSVSVTANLGQPLSAINAVLANLPQNYNPSTPVMGPYIPPPTPHYTQGQIIALCGLGASLQGGMNVPSGSAAAGDPSIDPSGETMQMPGRAVYEQTNQIPGQTMQGGRFSATSNPGPGAALGGVFSIAGTTAQCVGAANGIR